MRYPEATLKQGARSYSYQAERITCRTPPLNSHYQTQVVGDQPDEYYLRGGRSNGKPKRRGVEVGVEVNDGAYWKQYYRERMEKELIRKERELEEKRRQQ